MYIQVRTSGVLGAWTVASILINGMYISIFLEYNYYMFRTSYVATYIMQIRMHAYVLVFTHLQHWCKHSLSFNPSPILISV